MQSFINTILKFIKWPLAILCVVSVYPMLGALVQMMKETFSSDILLYFLTPAFGVMVIWGIIPGLSGSALTIFAHEATHMLAA